MNQWLQPLIDYRILIEADAVGDSEFQKLDEFFCRDLADIGEIAEGRNLELITCIATGTCMLAKRALPSTETSYFFFWVY